MWLNTDKGQLNDVIKYRERSTRKMWSNTDKGQRGRCDQIQIKVN